MAHIPLTDKAITLVEVDRLVTQTPISIQTNTAGYEDKLTKIQEILKTSAELQLVIAAYYNELIINSNTDHNQTVRNFNVKDFRWDSVTITKNGTSCWDKISVGYIIVIGLAFKGSKKLSIVFIVGT